MDSKLEARVDEIFSDVPKSDKIVTMINRIKSKANAKFLEIRNNGYSRSVAFNEVDDWLMKAKVIVDEEAGKLTPAEIASLPKTVDKPGTVVSSATMDDGEAAVVVERDSDAPAFDSAAFAATVDMSYSDQPAEAPAFEAEPAPTAEPAEKPKKAKKDKAEKPAKGKKSKKAKKEEEEEDDVEVPANKPSGKAGKIIGIICLVAGIALLVVAILILVGVISL